MSPPKWVKSTFFTSSRVYDGVLVSYTAIATDASKRPCTQVARHDRDEMRGLAKKRIVRVRFHVLLFSSEARERRETVKRFNKNNNSARSLCFFSSSRLTNNKKVRKRLKEEPLLAPRTRDDKFHTSIV